MEGGVGRSHQEAGGDGDVQRCLQVPMSTTVRLTLPDAALDRGLVTGRL